MTLGDLTTGSEARVLDLIGEGTLVERLSELGIYRGLNLRLLYRIPLNGPVVIQVGEGFVALRGEEARCIQITK